ncbi:MAG TPA: ADOP family duplicated permease [Bryobacteraceae bacterium]|jgi:predicted permease|nr:ADOP family duplicated permease [Bryobacteraceae bacterium]
MSWIRRLTASLDTRKLDRDLDRELAFHLAMREHERISAGAAPEDARREVLHRFGSVDRTKEACREQSTFGWLVALRQDLRYAARNLRRNPAFTAAAAACLAIGIGANTVVFSFVNAFLFQPEPPGVVRVGFASGSPIPYRDFEEWQRTNPVFDRMFAYAPGELFTLGRGPAGRQVLGETTVGDYFETLGVTPAVGRLPAPRDELQPLAVISCQLWRDLYRADPAIAGKAIWIDGRPFTIAGVAPERFHGMMAPWSTEVWITAALRLPPADPGTGWLAVGAHLKDGVTLRQAAGAMQALAREVNSHHPDSQRRSHDPLVVERPGLSTSPVWQVFLMMSVVLMAVVGIIYLIACANVAGLLMARGAARRREIFIRLSLGVSRSRLVRQLLAEGMLLALLGAAAGTAVAFLAGNATAALFPKSISHGFVFQHDIDLHVLAWTLALAVASVLFAALLPSLRASRQNLGAPGRTPRLRQGLIVAQVAASVLVLATAGIFIRSFQKALAVDPGFNAAHLVTVDLNLHDAGRTPAELHKTYQQMKGALAAIPGVDSVSLAAEFPFGNQHVQSLLDLGEVAAATVDADYFRALGIPLVRGREPLADESAVVVNQEFVRHFWSGRDPLLQSLRGPVVGVAADSKYWSLAESPRPFIYQVQPQFDRDRAVLAVRTQGPAAGFASQVGQLIRRLNPAPAPAVIQTGEQRLHMWLEPQRAAAILLGVLGFAALALAITGLYALLAQMLVERTPEIAVRVALGASRMQVLTLVLRQSGVLLAGGTALGIAASAAVAHLFPGGMLDAPTLLAIVTLLAMVGSAATALPAYRALRVDPATALRSE